MQVKYRWRLSIDRQEKAGDQEGLRLAVDRLVPARFEEDEAFFREGDFLELFFGVFRAEDFLAVLDRVGAFFALPFPAEVCLCVEFLAADFLAEDFVLDDRLLEDFFCACSRASTAPPIPAIAAPLAAAKAGFSATTPTAFFAPEPTFFAPVLTADAASPACSFTVDIVDGSIPSSSSPPRDEEMWGEGLRPAALAACSWMVWDTPWALS
jgi:hypothetical protein